MLIGIGGAVYLQCSKLELIDYSDLAQGMFGNPDMLRLRKSGFPNLVSAELSGDLKPTHLLPQSRAGNAK